MEPSPLLGVNKTLESLGLQPTLRERDEEVPFDISLVPLGYDARNRPLMLQVHQYDHKSSPVVGADSTIREEMASVEQPNVEFTILNFLLTLPLEIPEDKAPEVLRFVALMNKAFPLGALNFSEVERSVYFAYGLPIFATPPCDMTVLMILNTVLFAKDTAFPGIDDIVLAGQTVDALIEKTAEGLPERT